MGSDPVHPLNQILDELRGIAARIDHEDMQRLVDVICCARRIFVAGMGRSGLMARALAMRLMHLRFEVYVVGDTTTPSIREGDLLVCCSRYGRSRSLKTYIDKAHEEGAQAAVITMTPRTPLARQSDHVFVIPVSGRTKRNPDTRQPLGTAFEQTLLLYVDAVTALAMQKLGISEEDMAEQHTQLE